MFQVIMINKTGDIILQLNIFRGMFKSVVAALNESLDITLHLQPLISHFKVNEMSTSLIFSILKHPGIRGNRIYRHTSVIPPLVAHHMLGLLH